jgi:hypothetical protein
MSWAWITGNLTEHEMKEEHGLELERIKAAEKKKLVEFGEAAPIGGGRMYHIHRERGEKEKAPSLRRFYGTVQNLNEKIKNWKGM